MRLRVLKLGWEFPPHSYGGLGVACHGLVHGLTQNDVEVLLVLPRHQSHSIKHCRIITTDNATLTRTYVINSLLQPYITSHEYQAKYHKNPQADLYGKHIFAEVERYAHAIKTIIQHEQFDIIHAHDWMSFKAGVFAKKMSKKPLIVHIHATEFDRTGGNSINQYVYDIERWGMHEADKIIAVSQFTKNKLIQHYAVPEHKIHVVHNAITKENTNNYHEQNHFSKQGPLVLFLGRLTLQKGPDYFITAAQKVLEFRPHVLFLIAGSGDMEHHLIEWVCAAKLQDKILFTGQLSRTDVQRAYKSADLFVMPSVSEPFGLTVLEAMQHGTPVIMSKQSGVSEVVGHALKIDFWDINELVNKIVAVIDHSELRGELAKNAYQEVQKFNWNTVAHKCISLYKQCIRYFAQGK